MPLARHYRDFAAPSPIRAIMLFIGAGRRDSRLRRCRMLARVMLMRVNASRYFAAPALVISLVAARRSAVPITASADVRMPGF